ncbi:hypothetical protein FFLO_06812 [Filobasidium floriforme]|uniref:Uncharacterized protein n=1 Tax=Filobasidium floriforme TaxID=5210 RepID=A0A8K0NMN5_9TREE|nr:uncharacterized protein HD553DRAFT_366762 [Filobasidium floriforme]KAG7527560.1 hypothetical protein FFLO_06812 [Filobasidium floriforme]KAH8088546.1 hypothetical protein HD553DRAFT_366762 [Filobasidium floriforme]
MREEDQLQNRSTNMLAFITASLAIGVLGVNAGPQCAGSNPDPTGQGFGAIYHAKAEWGNSIGQAAVTIMTDKHTGLECSNACWIDYECKGVQWEESTKTCTNINGEGAFWGLDDGPHNNMIAVKNAACGQDNWVHGKNMPCCEIAMDKRRGT